MWSEKSIADFGIKFEIKKLNGVDTIEIRNTSLLFTLMPLYIRGSNWIEEFNEVVRCMQERCLENVIIMGDINVRIGEEQQITDSHIIRYASINDTRKSKDKILNSNGKKFLTFCNNYGLLILNGRTRGDENGEFTFVCNIGTSVNDLCAASVDVVKLV